MKIRLEWLYVLSTVVLRLPQALFVFVMITLATLFYSEGRSKVQYYLKVLEFVGVSLSQRAI